MAKTKPGNKGCFQKSPHAETTRMVKALSNMRRMPLTKCVAEKVIETYNKQRRQGVLAPLESVVEA